MNDYFGCFYMRVSLCLLVAIFFSIAPVLGSDCTSKCSTEVSLTDKRCIANCKTSPYYNDPNGLNNCINKCNDESKKNIVLESCKKDCNRCLAKCNRYYPLGSVIVKRKRVSKEESDQKRSQCQQKCLKETTLGEIKKSAARLKEKAKWKYQGSGY